MLFRIWTMFFVSFMTTILCGQLVVAFDEDDVEQLLRVGHCVECDLIGVDFSEFDLRGMDLRSAELLGANLSNANLVGIDLRGAYLMEANLSGADLTSEIGRASCRERV